MKNLEISLLLALLLTSSLAFVPQASSAAFSTPLNLGAGLYPNVQSVGSHTYVAWTVKNTGIYFRASADGGQTWSSVVKIGAGGQYPLMSANGNHVFIVWSSGGIMFSSSSDYGATWSKPVKLSSNGAVTPAIASSGALVSVVYNNGGGSSVTSSSDSGTTWTKPFQYSNGPEPQVAISGTNVYLAADDSNKAHVQFGVSHDSGKTWKISSLPAGSEPWLAATGSNVYVVWETKSAKSVVWFMSSTNNGNTFNTKIISTGIPDAWNPMINAMGNSLWVGIQELGNKAQIWMIRSTDGGTTWTSAPLTGSGHGYGFVLDVSTSDANNVYAMWVQQSVSTWNTMIAYSSNGGNSWSVTSVGPSDPNNDVAIGSISSSGAHETAAWQYNSAIWFTYS